MKIFHQYANKLFLGFAVVLFASCASEQTITTSKSRSGLDRYNDGYEMERGDHGMMKAGSSKVSEYDRKGTNIGSRDFSGKNYNKESYRKERWGGNKKYASKQYGGKTDGSRFKHSPHYVSRDTRAQGNGQYSNANNSQFNTGTYAARSTRANEGSESAIKTNTSGYVSSRNNAPDPLIMTKDQYSKLNVRDTKKMLGRQ